MMRLLVRFSLCLLFLPVVCGPASLNAALAWSRSHAIQPPVPLTNLFGTVFALQAGGSGFVMLGSSQETSSGESRLVQSLGRFDDSGSHLWSVLLDGGPGSSEPLLNAFNDPARLQASYNTGGDSVRVGVYRGADLARQFAVEVEAFEPDFDTIVIDSTPRFLDNGETALVELGDSRVRVVLLDASGGRKIDKIYQSSVFAAGAASFIPPTGSMTFERLPDGTGYLLALSISVPEFQITPPFSFSYDNTISLLCLDNSGNLRWARTVVMNDTGGEVSQTSWPAASGQIIMVLSETTALAGLSEDTHLLRFAANGSLTWARTLDDTAPYFVHVDGGDLWFFGATGDRSDLRVLRLNDLNGTIAAQARLDSGAFDGGTAAGLVGGRVFLTMQSVTGGNDDLRRALALSLDVNLQNPVARRYHANVGNLTMSYHAASGSFIFSPFDSVNGDVEVVSLTTALAPVTDCGLFSDATITVVNTGLISQPLTLTPAAPAINIANAGTVLAATDIPLQSVPLNTTSLCGGNGNPAAPRLSIRVAPGGGLDIRFNSEPGVNYEVRSAANVAGPYNTILATLSGTGAELTYHINSASTGNRFYVVRAVRP